MPFSAFLQQADEVFTTGTAVVVCSVGSLTYRGNRKQYTSGDAPGERQTRFMLQTTP